MIFKNNNDYYDYVKHRIRIDTVNVKYCHLKTLFYDILEWWCDHKVLSTNCNQVPKPDIKFDYRWFKGSDFGQ